MTQPPEGGPQQGPRFGTQPYDPSAVGGPMAEPPKYARLKQYTLLSLAIFVVSVLVSLIPVFTGDLRESAIEQYEAMGMSQEEMQAGLDIVVPATLATTGLLLVVGVALYLLVYFGLKGRKNWARILGIVFAILGVVGMLISSGGGLTDPTAMNIIGSVLTLAGAVVGILWLLTAFSAEVRTYLSEGSQV